MTTSNSGIMFCFVNVVEAYRLDRYDNLSIREKHPRKTVVEAYRLDRYDNYFALSVSLVHRGCRSLSFG